LCRTLYEYLASNGSIRKR